MKKNVRKFTAMLIAVVMLIGILPAIGAFAATTTVTTAANTIKGFVYEEQGNLSYSTEHAYSGAKSLKIVANNQETFTLKAANYFVNGFTYDFEYYIYVKYADRIYNRMSWDNNSNANIYSANKMNTGTLNVKTTVEAVTGQSVGEGQWYRVTGTDYVGGNGGDTLGFFSFVGAAEVYIDDLKITCTTPGGIIPSNPSTGFEDFVEGTQAFPESIDGFSKLSNSNKAKATAGAYEVRYATEKAYDGARSLYINTMRKQYTGSESKIWLGTQADLGIANGKTYKMKFYIYPVNYEKAGSIMYCSLDGTYGNRQRFEYNAGGLKVWNIGTGSITRITSGNKAGWYEYIGPAITNANSWQPEIFIVECAAEFYLDDIQLYEVDNGVEKLVKEMTFEKEYALPKNILTTQVSSDTLSVSWRNPKSSEIAKVALYDVNTNTLLAENFDTSSDKVQEYKTTEYAQNDSQIYRLDFTFNDGVVKSYTTGYTTGKSWSYKVGTWTFSASEPKAPDKIVADDKVFHDAAPSLRIFSNATTGWESKSSLLELHITGKFDPAKMYRIEGWYKANNKGYVWARPFNQSGNDYRIYEDLAGKWNNVNTVVEWKKFSKDAKPVSETNRVLQFNFRNVVEDFWLDDLTVYELDEAGNPIGDDLVEGIGVIDAAEKPAELAAGEVTNSVNSAMLRWTAADDAAYVAVYDKAVGTEVPIAYVPAEMGYVELANLNGGNTYNFLLKAVNSEGRESANGVSETAQPLPEDLIVSDFAVNTSGGTANVSIDIKNNGMGDDFTAQLIVAVYESEDVLKNIKATGITKIAQTGASAGPVTLTQSITVPAGCTLKVYLWDSLDSMKPIKASRSY